MDLSYWWFNWNVMGGLGQYHGCWCPGSLRRQGISSHGIDCIGKICSWLPQGRIFNYLCHISVQKWWKEKEISFYVAGRFPSHRLIWCFDVFLNKLVNKQSRSCNVTVKEIGNFSIVQKYKLDYLNYIHIWQVSQQLSSVGPLPTQY